MTTLTPNEMRHVLEELDRLGLHDAAPEVRALHARGAELAGRIGATKNDLPALRARLAAGLADGSVDIDAAIDDDAQAATDAKRAAAAVDLWRQARKVADTRASKALERLGDGLLEQMRPVVDDALTAAQAAASKLPDDVTDDAAAVAAGSDPLAAWSTLTAAHTTWATAAGLARYLRDREILPASKYAARQDRHLYEMHHPEHATRVRPGRTQPHPVALFAADLNNGVDFAILTAAQLDERLAAQHADRQAEADRRRRAARSTQTAPRRGVAEEVAREVLAEEQLRAGAEHSLRDPAA